jgi:hypothetical protein
MSGDVTYCVNCGACNWAGKDKCRVCGGELELTLAQEYAYYCHTDPEFRKMVDTNNQVLGNKDGSPLP